MCGITGFTHWSRVTDPRVIRKATELLHHRGPDQHDVFVSPDVSLGAVRLKIVDLTGGEQPFKSDDERVVIAFNGEIYNHGALRSELMQRGHQFRSRCDTEVVLKAFLEWDTACFAKLRGMFALAVWCDRSKRLVLARDRVGIKPLYFSRRGMNLHFASELKSLWAHPDVPKELDSEALQDFLSLNYVPGPRTLVRDITKLRPGHYLEFTSERFSIEPYWKVSFTPESMPFEESCERLDGMLRESVQEHLSADVPVSVWLSGGLDSSTILHYASQCGVARPKTFSVAFENASCDERRYFREMACAYGTDHCEVELRADPSLPRVIEKLAHYSDEPGADAGALPVWYLSQLTAGSATVALSGEGGDELFGGYSTYLADAVAKRLRSVPALVRQRALNAANRYLPVSDEKISFEYKIKRLLEGSLLPADASHQFWNGTFSEQQKRRLLTDEYQRRMILDQSNRYPLASEIGFLNRYLLIDQSTYLPDNILYKVDRMSMAHSVEVRPALLDHRIVEFAARLPERYKIRGWTTKYILRQTMKSKLPALILKRPKRGFDIPTHEWFRGVLRPLLLDTLASDAVRNSGIFNLAAVRQLVESHMERKQNVGYHLWGLMTLGLWLQHWNIETAAVRESSQPETAAVYGT